MTRTRTTVPRTIGRLTLTGILTFTGVGHLSFGREAFQIVVPSWVPLDPDAVVVSSGVAELGLAGALVALPRERRRVGLVLAAFFVAIFPGNLLQYRERVDSVGMRTDRARFIRLLMQPGLVALALWSTAEPRRR